MNRPAAALTCALSMMLGACAMPPSYGPTSSRSEGEADIRRGTVTRIDDVSLDHPNQTGLGAVLGAAAGGLVGHQFGRGHGRDVATVLGAIGGGIAGHQVEGNYTNRQPGQHVFVQLRNGVTVAVTQPADFGLRVGDSVYVEGRGYNARVVRR
jgi:outer membrane lipoprotein SlyB